MKTFWIPLVVVGLITGLMLSSPVYALSGKAEFKKSCLKCHQEKKAKRVAPIDKASSQWKRFFKRKKHRRKYKVELAANLDQRQIKAILNYLIDHASDSDKPEVAGSL